MSEVAGAADERPRGSSLVPLTSVDAPAVLERLQNLALCDEGKISCISLSAVAERLGRKWPLRRELVHEHLDRTIRRQIGHAGIVLKLSDTDFLVAQPNETRLAGQLIALRCMRETLHYFLGEALIPDMIVHEVTQLTPTILHGERLNVGVVEAAAAEEERQARNQGPPEALRTKWSPFTTSDGRELHVTSSYETVVHLKSAAQIGHRVAGEVMSAESHHPLSHAELLRLNRTDIERIDFAVLQRTIAWLKTNGSHKDPALIVPISMTTLASTRARGVLRQLLVEAQANVKHGLICEICDIEGAPLSILAEAIGFLKPYSIYVIGRLDEPPKGGLSGLRDIGLAGLSIECPPLGGDDTVALAWLKARRPALKAVDKTAIVYRLPSGRAIVMAAHLGFTHGSLRERSDVRDGKRDANALFI